MKVHHMKPMKCPLCAYVMDASTNLTGGDVTPSPDDITVCLSCGGVLLYDHELQLRMPSPQELKEIQTLEDWPLIAKAAQHAKRPSTITGNA